MKRKITYLLISVAVLCSCFSVSVFADAEKADKNDLSALRTIISPKDIFCDDYTDAVVGSLPSGYSTMNDHAGYVKVAEYDVTFDDGTVVRKNCLELDDIYGDTIGQYMWAGPGFYRTFKGHGPRIAIEARMMFVEKTTPHFANELYTMSDNTYVTRWVASNGTGVPTWYSRVGFTEELPAFQKGIWYTHRIVIDLENNMAQIRVTAPQLGIDKTYTELGFCDKPAINVEYINKIFYDSQTGDGKMVFDYIKAEADPEDLPGAGEFVHPDELIEPVWCEAPVEHPVKGKVNLMVDGEYKYIATPMYIEDGVTMIYFKNLVTLFDGKVNADAGVTLNGVSITFNADSKTAIVNGVEKYMNASALEKDGKLFVPLRFAATEAGFNVGWNGETTTVLIERSAD